MGLMSTSPSFRKYGEKERGKAGTRRNMKFGWMLRKTANGTASGQIRGVGRNLKNGGEGDNAQKYLRLWWKTARKNNTGGRRNDAPRPDA